MNNIPWVEKYRPTDFDEIIFKDINKKLFQNMIEKKYFPNMLFYGQPGTGKTTTIINIVKKILNKTANELNKSIIHLNASDERGIDIIRNQIQIFVKSKHFFHKELKIIILDEVDYMTKNAQQALKNILQNMNDNVRFCLICNYISKIDVGLKSEFICIRFHQLPKNYIIQFVKRICENENIDIDEETIDNMYSINKNDIRTIINSIQLNNIQKIIDKNIFHTMIIYIYEKKDETEFINYIHTISIEYNIHKIEIILKLFQYVIYEYPVRDDEYIPLLQCVERIIHNINTIDIIVLFQYIWWHVQITPCHDVHIDVQKTAEIDVQKTAEIDVQKTDKIDLKIKHI